MLSWVVNSQARWGVCCRACGLAFVCGRQTEVCDFATVIFPVEMDNVVLSQ